MQRIVCPQTECPVHNASLPLPLPGTQAEFCEECWALGDHVFSGQPLRVDQIPRLRELIHQGGAV